MDRRRALSSFAALSQDTRLSIVRYLVKSGPDGVAAGDVADEVGVSASNLSFHLKELANSGLVTQERASRHLIYRAAYDNMNALLGYLTDNCCQGAACAVDATGDACEC